LSCPLPPSGLLVLQVHPDEVQLSVKEVSVSVQATTTLQLGESPKQLGNALSAEHESEDDVPALHAIANMAITVRATIHFEIMIAHYTSPARLPSPNRASKQAPMTMSERADISTPMPPRIAPHPRESDPPEG